MAETIEELTARHKKELKSLEGEKRAALKNAKSMGKKAKAKIKEVEFKYEGLERDLKERQRGEVEALNGGGMDEDENVDGADGGAEKDAVDTSNEQYSEATKEVTFDTTTVTKQTELDQQQSEQEAAQLKKQKALDKKLKKKLALKQKELDREARIAAENATAGPSPRILEMQSLCTQYLTPNKLRIEDVQADGNCLYRAVGVQAVRLGILSHSEASYTKIRSLCADTLLKSRSEYEPFAELNHDPSHPADTYEDYVENVRNTNTWGGQLELRALSCALETPVVVFSMEGPLTMGQEYGEDVNANGDEGWEKKKAVLVSFHRYYYALGEHYNSVVPMENGE